MGMTNEREGSADHDRLLEYMDIPPQEETPGAVVQEQEDENEGDAEKESVRTQAEELEELNDRYMRLAAEYDNYRKRSQREREAMTAYVVSDTVARFLPLLDSLEIAGKYKDASAEAVHEGLERVLRAMSDILAGLGLVEIDTSGTFDPELHNAVLHMEDKELPEHDCRGAAKGVYLWWQSSPSRHGLGGELSWNAKLS